jgi:hypothetical protein
MFWYVCVSPRLFFVRMLFGPSAPFLLLQTLSSLFALRLGEVPLEKGRFCLGGTPQVSWGEYEGIQLPNRRTRKLSKAIFWSLLSWRR